MAKNDDYYKVETPHKRVKKEIVSSYLPAWASIIGRYVKPLHYFDLFAGRG